MTADDLVCPSCGADPRLVLHVGDEPGPERRTRPIEVAVLAVLYLALAVRYVLLSGVLGASTDESDAFLWIVTGGVLLVPAGVLCVLGAGFLLRSRWAPGLAIVVGGLALLGALVGGIADVVEADEAPFLVALEGLVGLLVAALHLVLVSSDAVTGWFR